MADLPAVRFRSVVPFVRWKVVLHRVDARRNPPWLGGKSSPGLVWIKARQKRSPRRNADRAIVELRESQTLSREAVDVRGRNFRTETTDVGIAQIVGHDENDVGLRFIRHQR